MTLAPYQPHLDWIDAQKRPMVALLEQWSRINTGSRNVAGVLAMREALSAAFGSLGGRQELLPVKPLESVNGKGEVAFVPLGEALRIRKRSDAPIQVFLCGHMDTVYPADSPFQTTRWLDDNTLNGPGVADLKGGLVCMLTALQALERSPFAERIGWEVLLNPDEEVGSQGSAPLLEEAAKRNRIGLVYEPALADGTLAGARKGSGNFSLVVKGRAAHAGREFDQGRNAIALLAEITMALNGLNGQRGGVTLNPGRVEGGGPVNIVADTAVLHFNVRMGTPADQDWLQEQFSRILKEYAGRDGYSLALHGGFTRPPKHLSEANEKLFAAVQQCGEMLDIKVNWVPTGGCCDGNNLAAYGLPNVDTLGVRGGRIHSEEEFVLVDSLPERAKLSALLLMRLANGEIAL